MVQKPNFLLNWLLMATPVGGASLPKGGKTFVDAQCLVKIMEGTEINFIETCEVGGPLKLQIPFIADCDVSEMLGNVGETINELVLVTVVPP